MGLFNRIIGKNKKNKLSQTPPRPSINNEQDFVIWMLKYDEQLNYFRKMVISQGLDVLVEGVAKDIMHVINTCQSKEALMDKLADIGEFYDKMKPLIHERGGNIMLCPEEIRIYYIDFTTKLTILPYFLKYKYNEHLLFDTMGLKEL